MQMSCARGDIEEFGLEEALARYHARKLQMPEDLGDDHIPTLNTKGMIFPPSDDASKDFIDTAPGKRVLEVGGGYGHVMRTLLQKDPGTSYHLNDLSEEHLYVAAGELARTAKQPQEQFPHVRFIRGDITELETDHPYDAILAAYIWPYLSPTQLQTAVSRLYRLLKPGGRLYAVALTPYLKSHKKFVPEYEKRLSRAKPDPFPGYVQNIRDWLSEDAAGMMPENILNGPFMFMDDKVFSQSFETAGFKIVTCKMVPLSYTSEWIALDGRENVILIAEKPRSVEKSSL